MYDQKCTKCKRMIIHPYLHVSAQSLLSFSSLTSTSMGSTHRANYRTCSIRSTLIEALLSRTQSSYSNPKPVSELCLVFYYITSKVLQYSVPATGHPVPSPDGLDKLNGLHFRIILTSSSNLAKALNRASWTRPG